MYSLFRTSGDKDKLKKVYADKLTKETNQYFDDHYQEMMDNLLKEGLNEGEAKEVIEESRQETAEEQVRKFLIRIHQKEEEKMQTPPGSPIQGRGR